MSKTFSGTLVKYDVHVGNGDTVTMQGESIAVDKIIHQMRTWQPMYKALKSLLNNLPVSELEIARECWGNTNTNIIIQARKEAEAALDAAGGSDE